MQLSENSQTGEKIVSALTDCAHIFFMDGVGLGGDDPAVNPFVRAHLPHLTDLLGEGWYLQTNEIRSTARATLAPTDATMGVAGRPQSATGQATILTGRNVPRLLGRHYGPKPNSAVAEVLRAGSLFQEVVDAGGGAALITPYPQQYFEAIDSGRRLLSAVPLAATSAGLSLMTADDLQKGRAVSPNFTGEGWRTHLGYDNIPLLTLEAAGRQIATVARRYHFSFFEHWPSDRLGHRGTLEEAVQHLERIDAVLGGLLDAWDDSGLLIITSDHGNIENKSYRQHTENPVPTILIGPGHATLAAMIDNLSDLARVVRRHLALDHQETTAAS
ncbi:MAG: metalloenzyme domain-containing protein [Chloroflexota bacterium]